MSPAAADGVTRADATMVAASGDDPAAVEYARYLGIEPHEDAAMMHIAREAVVAELPPGWEEHADDDGNMFFYNEEEDRSVWEHPCDAHYRELVVKTRKEIGLHRPGKAAPGAHDDDDDAPFEISAFPATSAVGQGAAAEVSLPAKLPGADTAAQPSTEVKVPESAAADDGKKYLSSIGNPEARTWWAEQVGRKRVRTRQMAKLLAAWLLAQRSGPEDNARGLGPQGIAAAEEETDEVVYNSSTTRECARTIASAMEKEEGRVGADDFGAFVADALHGAFSPAALRSLARKLQPRGRGSGSTGGAKRRQQAAAAVASPGNSLGEDSHGYDSTPGKQQQQQHQQGSSSMQQGGMNAEMRAFEMTRDSRASAVRLTRIVEKMPLFRLTWLHVFPHLLPTACANLPGHGAAACKSNRRKVRRGGRGGHSRRRGTNRRRRSRRGSSCRWDAQRAPRSLDRRSRRRRRRRRGGGCCDEHEHEPDEYEPGRLRYTRHRRRKRRRRGYIIIIIVIVIRAAAAVACSRQRQSGAVALTREQPQPDQNTLLLGSSSRGCGGYGIVTGRSGRPSDDDCWSGWCDGCCSITAAACAGWAGRPSMGRRGGRGATATLAGAPQVLEETLAATLREAAAGAPCGAYGSRGKVGNRRRRRWYGHYY